VISCYSWHLLLLQWMHRVILSRYHIRKPQGPTLPKLLLLPRLLLVWKRRLGRLLLLLLLRPFAGTGLAGACSSSSCSSPTQDAPDACCHPLYCCTLLLLPLLLCRQPPRTTLALALLQRLWAHLNTRPLVMPALVLR
jgi:hypothetical protein